MKKTFLLFLLLALFVLTTVGCSNAGPRKYVFFGEPKAQKVELFEDYWSDFPFKPDDPELPLRRGKGGVIRFFKKNSYTRSIMVDGELTVNVYFSVEDGVTLTQPDMQLVVSSEELNQKHRKFDKETGYTYHVYLDLGVYDQPEQEITILSIFKDAKTGQATLSKEIRTVAMGSTPLEKEDDVSEGENEAVRWARKHVDSDTVNPIAELQAKYSARNKAEREKNENDSRVKETVDLNDSQFEEINGEPLVKSVSYLEETEAKRKAAIEKALEQNQEKNEYYRDLRRRQLEEFNESQARKTDSVSPLRDSRGVSSALNFNASANAYKNFQAVQENQFRATAERITNRAIEEQTKDPANTMKGASKKTLGDERYFDDAKDFKEYQPQSDSMSSVGANAKKRIASKTRSAVPDGFTTPQNQTVVDMDNLRPSEMDKLDDFQPDDDVPPTEIYTKKTSK